MVMKLEIHVGKFLAEKKKILVEKNSLLIIKMFLV